MQKRNFAPLAVTQGDPAGVGAEVILKAAAAITKNRRVPLLVIGDLGAMRATARRLGKVPEPVEWRSGKVTGACDSIPVLSLSSLNERSRVPGRPTVEGADAAYRYVVQAARITMAGETSGLVTAPISKEWINRAGHRVPGHSELLAKLARVRLWRMMLAGDRLRVALVTVHLPLAEVPSALTSQRVYDTIVLLASHLRTRLGIAAPRIIVLGLNPHAGEHGLFGKEERRIIAPAIARARRARVDAFGPVSPDTAFIKPRGSFEFDGAVAMYHDQGLIPLKALEFDRAVNVTLGLPFVRTSPDHGTAFDIAGQGKARASSMLAAIEYAWAAARMRVTGSVRAA